MHDLSPISDAARRLLDRLRRANCTRDAPTPQRTLATALDLPVREVQQDLALELLAAGFPVATTCTAGGGMYLARTAADLEPYLAQLASRHQRLGLRIDRVRACQIRLEAREAAEREAAAPNPDGQLILFGGGNTR